MSYILDALRKAERERRLGGIPGIDLSSAPAQPVPASGWPAWLALGLVANAAVVAGALLLWHNGVLTSPRSSEAMATAAKGTAPAESGGAVVVPESTDEAHRQSPPVAAVAASQPAPAATAVPKPASASKPAPPTPRALPPPPALAELAESFRQSLPPLELTVHVYSESPAQRFVFVNGRRYREGQQISEGPLLESIQPRGVILKWKGQRFLMVGEW